MKPIAICLVTVALSSSLLLAQNAQPAAQAGAQGDASTSAAAATKAGSSSASLAEGSTVHVVLNKSLDAKKNKPGDEVVAKTSEALKSTDGVTIPKGTKLIGHVTEAQARTKSQSESKLGIAFDHFLLKDGSQVPFTASIQAIAQAETSAAASSDYDEPGLPPTGGGPGGSIGRSGSASPGGTRGSSPLGTVAQTTSTVTNTAGQAVGQAAGVSSAGQLSAESRGVIGLNGLSLDAQTSASEGSLIRSERQNVRLDSGTRILLRMNAK